MLKTLIIREMQEYIKSKKFLIGLFITLVLVTVTTIINIEDYAKRQQDYLDAKQDMDKNEKLRPPQVLSILAFGKDQKLGNRVGGNPMTIGVEATGYLGEYESKHQMYLSGFRGIDFVFLVKFVFSIIVIFLAYNVVSGEKENGTLKQMLANNLPRDKIILSKCISGLIIIVISLFCAIIVSLLIMLFHPAVDLGTSELIRLGGMIGVSILYLIAFYTLSLFISVMVNRSSTSLMILLELWIFFVIIYPNAGVMIADKSFAMPTKLEIALKRNDAAQPYYKEGANFLDEYNKEFNVRLKQNPDIKVDYTDERLVKQLELYNKAMEAGYRVERHYSNELKRQAELAQNIAIFSPAVLFDRVMLRFARTGLNEYESFLDGVFIYWQRYQQYIGGNPRTKKEQPESTYISETTIESLNATMRELFILFMYCVLFFLLADTAFLRKDVR